MNKVFIRDIEEVREFVKMHSDEHFDAIIKKMMRR